MSILLVNLEQVKLDRRITHSEWDDDLNMKIGQASAMVMNHMKATSYATIPKVVTLGTSPETYTIPLEVEQVTLLVLGELFENREGSSEAIKAALSLLDNGFRDPSMA